MYHSVYHRAVVVQEQPERDGAADKSAVGAAAAAGVRVDDDEDRGNPAYIPRKGAFFEHDLRTDDDSAKGDGADKKDDK